MVPRAIHREEIMTTEAPSRRAPFAEQTLSVDKQQAGRTEVFDTQLEIRNLDGAVDDALHAWIHERLGRQLGKYGPRIERVEVRFGDENGPKGGIDRNCMVHVVLSKLPPVVVEMRAAEDREAFDLAAGSAERALRHSMQKHGFNNKHKGRQRGEHAAPDEQMVKTALEEAAAFEANTTPASADDTHEPLYGKRVGRGQDELDAVMAQKHQASIDTSQPGVSANLHQLADGHTATRNTKLHANGAAYDLEDSTNGRPSRKSTRAGKNRIKHGQAQALQTKTSIHSPQERATRARRG
jgi:putative sigma-54 modulation protein